MNRRIDNEQEMIEDEIDDDMENDLYLMELHKRLCAMKKERKKAEQDAHLLDNRLKLLKGEEDKTLKKIEVTRKKTQEKMVSLQKQEEQLKLKLELKEQREREIEMKKDQNNKLKNELSLNLAMKREQKMKQIMEEAQLLKAQKRNNYELMNYIKIEEMSNNKSKAEYIKNQQQMVEEKKRALELEKKNKIKLELERKILEEQRMKENADGKLMDLEQEEVEVMKRIRTTTQVHRAMVEDFEKMSVNNLTSIREDLGNSESNTPYKKKNYSQSSEKGKNKRE